MKYFLNLLSLTLLLPFFSTAQSNYKPGYVVTLQGDTLKGVIDYREWDNNPKQITYKSNIGQVQEFDVRNAKAFAINGLEYYERYVVSVSQDAVDVSNINSKVDGNYRTDTVFFHVLNQGKFLKLYSYKDNIKQRFYILETGQSAAPQELEYHIYYDSETAESARVVTRYRVQLQYEAQKAGVQANVSNLIQAAQYSQDDLIKVVSKINGNTSTQFTAKQLFGTRLFAGVDVSDNNLQFIGDFSTPKGSNISPVASFGVDLMPNKNIQRIFLRMELSITGDHHNFYAPGTLYNNNRSQDIYFNQYTASIAPQVVFNIYNTQMFKIFISGGMSFNFSTYPNSYFKEIYSNNTSLSENNLFSYHAIWESFPIKVGVFLNKKLEIYACYLPSEEVTDNTIFYSVNVYSYRAGINYLFGK